MASESQYGLIILGNSGVGKSFLANILLGHEAFARELSASSVTHITEYEEMVLGHCTLAVFNIPGLIEAEQQRIDLNKQEIDKAFAQRPNSIVMFVLGQTGGRIRDEDIVAFHAINEAYPFRPQSFVLVVNDLPKYRPVNYEGETLVLLQQLLSGVPVNDRNLCFLDSINGEDATERQRLKEQLLQVIVEFTPSIHEKKQEIETLIDQLKQGMERIKKQRAQFETDRKKHMKQIDDSQRLLNETIANHRSETESLQRAIQRQGEMYAEEKRRPKEENQRYQTQFQEMRNQVQGTFDQMSNDNELTLSEIQASRETYEESRRSYEGLITPSPTIQYKYDNDDDSSVISSLPQRSYGKLK